LISCVDACGHQNAGVNAEAAAGSKQQQHAYGSWGDTVAAEMLCQQQCINLSQAAAGAGTGCTCIKLGEMGSSCVPEQSTLFVDATSAVSSWH
jgi:hypothetical protein